MGTRGPKPTPTNILRLRGSELLAKRQNEPTGSDGPPLVLPFVANDEVARRYFDRLIEDLRRLGLYAAEDYAAHNAWAQACAEFERAEATCRERGLVLETAQGAYISPWKKLRDDARSEVARLGKCFGLTPADRVGLSSKKDVKGDASGIETLLKSTA
jgi:P27 family predicted phage terminase small subunit